MEIKKFKGEMMKWNEFVENIYFEKIKNIKKGIKDENMEEGLKVRKF